MPFADYRDWLADGRVSSGWSVRGRPGIELFITSKERIKAYIIITINASGEVAEVVRKKIQNMSRKLWERQKMFD